MSNDEKILISKCISELHLQVEFFEKNKFQKPDPYSKTWMKKGSERSFYKTLKLNSSSYEFNIRIVDHKS